MGYVILGIAVIIIVVMINIYNRIVTYKIKVEEAASGVDVALAKRYAVLINTVEVVKGYAKHEAETLAKVVEARNDMTMTQKTTCYQEYKEAQTKLFALQESYPDLKANESFLSLQKELTTCEEKITYARQFYNDSVLSYNNKIELFPSSIIASMFHFEKEKFFEASAEERKNVQVKF